MSRGDFGPGFGSSVADARAWSVDKAPNSTLAIGTVPSMAGLAQGAGPPRPVAIAAGEIASKMSQQDAEDAVRMVVTRAGGRPAGTDLDLAPHEQAAMLRLGVDEGAIVLRAAEARSKLRDKLTPLARQAVDVDADIARLKAAFLAEHAKCYDPKPGRLAAVGPDCDVSCRRAQDAWRLHGVRTQPARKALAKLRELAVPAHVKRGETLARAALVKAKHERQEAASRRNEALGVVQGAVQGDATATHVKVYGEMVERLNVTVAEAEAAHAAIVAERERLTLEVDLDLRAMPMSAAPVKAAPAAKRSKVRA